MEWPWLFLCLFLHTTGGQKSQTFLQTPGRIVALNNSTTEMVCAMKSEQLSHVGIYWFRKSKSPDFEYILFATVMRKFTHGNGIDKGRFTVNKESFRNSYTLKISKLQSLDSGTYYCAVSYNSELLLGNGTELSVVDSFPPTEKPTKKTPPPKKPSGCRSSSLAHAKKKGSSCSGFIWVPLAACVVILLVCLVVAIHRFQRLRRRMQLHFRKQVLK
ncbi:T-cell surface glycoprotein CD8 beta chain [Carettochelys insculpta]|uniref:T-cell surface glycoprotein CD8 beta chain n=1 Tax=Carettochelys insculpta TaxID=44489 RepID=UPI003EB8BF52